jgi:hypothetical protein
LKIGAIPLILFENFDYFLNVWLNLTHENSVVFWFSRQGRPKAALERGAGRTHREAILGRTGPRLSAETAGRTAVPRSGAGRPEILF